MVKLTQCLIADRTKTSDRHRNKTVSRLTYFESQFRGLIPEMVISPHFPKQNKQSPFHNSFLRYGIGNT